MMILPKSKRLATIFNYAFLLALFVLVLNDHYLKAEFSNWYTGKLSDFAGIFLFPLFLCFLFPIKIRNAVLWTIVLFVWWKSPFSQMAIDTFNRLSFFSITRVVDYTDFLAFLMLPASVYVLKNIEQFELKISSKQYQGLAVKLTFIVTIATFIATSRNPPYPMSPIEDCCGLSPTEEEVGLGKLFIATAFTPDGNGLNDYFLPIVDSNIVQIDTFVLYDVHGKIVFNNGSIQSGEPEEGFNGVVQDTILAASYNYEVKVTSIDGVSAVFYGLVCCLPCSEPLQLPKPISLDNCIFPIQHTFEKGFDPTLPSQETLDCFD